MLGVDTAMKHVNGWQVVPVDDRNSPRHHMLVIEGILKMRYMYKL